MELFKKKQVGNREDKRIQALFEAMPLGANFWTLDLRSINCNPAALKMFGLHDKKEFGEKFFMLSPEYQPCGTSSREKADALFKKVYEEGYCRFEWLHQNLKGEPLPCEVTLVRVEYGDDHIIAAYMRDLREQKKIMSKLERQNNLLQMVNLVATAMLTIVEDEKFEDSLLSGLELICHCMDVDRVQIWQNETIENELYFVLKYEQLSNTGRHRASVPIGLKFPYSAKPGWKNKFLHGEYINSPFCDLPPEDKDFLRLYDIKSIVIIPLFLQDHFWGFFSVDDCQKERTFTEEEIDIFRSTSLMMASAVYRHTQVAEIQKAENDLRLARDAAEAANKAKSSFLANMSHEIRTPMNSIVGFSELALDGEVSPKTRDYLVKILENADGLLQIINDVLDISKVESGKMELEHIPFDIHELFTSCRTLIMPKAVEKGIMLHFYAEPSVGRRPLGDPTRLRQVLVNLLTNAIKFTNVGMVKLLADITSTSEKSISMHFEVKDTGIGMFPQQIEKIFDPFIQAETGTTRKYGGTGLGLAITKNIIEMMGGELSVESTPGLGSKFSFDLTFETIGMSVDSMFRKKMLLNEIEKPAFEGEILLCEDNVMNQHVICEHLARVGLKTTVADNGKIGVEMVRNRIKKGEKQFDLIFMDMHMPVMDGLEAAAKIFELNAGVPIVAMTANIMSDDMDVYRKSGMHDCVGKPFTSQELWRCLMKYFTPKSGKTATKDEPHEADSQFEIDPDLQLDFQKTLQILFAKNNQKKFEEIVNALEAGDIKLAHRLAHTLKSNAGQLGKTLLQQTAADIERQLKEGKNLVSGEQLRLLKTELGRVLTEFAPLLDEPPAQPADQATVPEPKPVLEPAKVQELFEKLKPLLEGGNPECLNLIDDLRAIPGSEELIRQLDDFEFETALVSLAALKNNTLPSPPQYDQEKGDPVCE